MERPRLGEPWPVSVSVVNESWSGFPRRFLSLLLKAQSPKLVYFHSHCDKIQSMACSGANLDLQHTRHQIFTKTKSEHVSLRGLLQTAQVYGELSDLAWLGDNPFLSIPIPRITHDPWFGKWLTGISASPYGSKCGNLEAFYVSSRDRTSSYILLYMKMQNRVWRTTYQIPTSLKRRINNLAIPVFSHTLSLLYGMIKMRSLNRITIRPCFTMEIIISHF